MKHARNSSRLSHSVLTYSQSLLIIALVITMATPAALASSLLSEGASKAEQIQFHTLNKLEDWFKTKVAAQEPVSTGVKPRRSESKSEKEARLARLELNATGNVVLQSQQPMWFTAIPFDSEGSAIHGLQAEWESSDRQVVFDWASTGGQAGQRNRHRESRFTDCQRTSHSDKWQWPAIRRQKAA